MATTGDPWQHQRVLQYIKTNGFGTITLQFPDELLQHATTVAQELQQLLRKEGSAAKVYVLADTSYNPLSIDEVAAAHVKADCVVHYGYASLHPVSRTPALCVLPQQQLDVQETSTWLVQQLALLHDKAIQAAASNSNSSSSTDDHPGGQQQQQQQQESPVCVICSDQGYLHQLPQLQQAVLQAYQGPLQLVFAQSAPTELWPQQHSKSSSAQGSSPSAASSAAAAAADTDTDANTVVPVGGLMWQLPAGSSNGSRPAHMVWLGPSSSSSAALTHLQLTYATCPWLMLDPVGQGIAEGLSPGLDRMLKRRYYLVERARGAAMVGLLVGTLGAAGYKTALEQLRSLAAKAGKKTYTLLMGKPNPAKLANFPEIEVFVMLADPQGLILDSKEYLRPIITPHEAYLAFAGRDFDAAHYRLDFGDLLQLGAGDGGQQQQQQRQQQQAAACPASGNSGMNLAGNVTEIEGSDDDDDDGVENAVEQVSAAAGALTIANSLHSHALTGDKAGWQVQVHSAAQYLAQQRTYQGLETPATGAAILPAAVAVHGRAGRAAGYTDEPQH